MGKNEEHKEEHYEVTYIQVKASDVNKAMPIIEAAWDHGSRPYIQIVPDKAIMLQVSTIDEWMMQSIEIWLQKGFQVSINTGKPPGGGCPPGGCP